MLALNSVVQLLMTYRYVILFPIAWLEGPVTSVICGFLVHAGYLSVLPTYIILLLGDFIPDTLCYMLGRYGHKSPRMQKYIQRSGVFSKNLELLKKLWLNHPRKSVFFSKIAYGLSTPLLISAGLSNMSFGKFASYAFTVTAVEYGLFMILGYYIGHSYEALSGYIGWIGYLATAFIVALAIGYFAVQKFAREQIEEIEKE